MPIELISEDWLSIGTLVVEYTDARTGRRRCWADTGIRVCCELPPSAVDLEVSFEEPFFGGRLTAVNRDDPQLPWVVDKNGDYDAEVFDFPAPPGCVRYYLRGSAISGSFISKVEMLDAATPSPQDSVVRTSSRQSYDAVATTPEHLRRTITGITKASGPSGRSRDARDSGSPAEVVSAALERCANFDRARQGRNQRVPMGQQIRTARTSLAISSSQTPSTGTREGLPPLSTRPRSSDSDDLQFIQGATMPRQECGARTAYALQATCARPPRRALTAHAGLLRNSSVDSDEENASQSPAVRPSSQSPQHIAHALSALNLDSAFSPGDRDGAAVRGPRGWLRRLFRHSEADYVGDAREEVFVGDAREDAAPKLKKAEAKGALQGVAEESDEDSENSPASSASSLSSDYHNQDDDSPPGHDRGATPSTVRRRVTDARWIWVLVAALSLLVYVAVMVSQPCLGRRISWFRDYANRPCNWGFNGGKPFLYFCANRGAVDVFAPICVAECPQGGNTSHSCPGTNATTGERVFHEVRDYASTPFRFDIAHGHLCRPKDLPHFQYTFNGDYMQLLIFFDMAVAKHWRKIVVCITFGVVWALVYVRLLRNQAGILVWGSLFLLFAALVVWAGMCFIGYHSWVCGTIIAVCTVCFGIFVDRQRDLINKTTVCIELACKCVLDMPVLKFTPILLAVLRIWICIGAFLVTRKLLACGWIVVGSHTEFALSVAQKLALAYILFMCAWMNFVLSAAWSFIAIYATSLWYFKGARKKSGVFGCSGFWVLMRYHLGSVIMGGLLSGLAAPFRFLVGLLTVVTRGEGFDAPVCCTGLAEFYEAYLEPLGKRAYADIVMNSADFATAAQFGQKVSRAQLETVQAVHAACGIFQVLGVVVVYILTRMAIAILLFRECASAMGNADEECREMLDSVFQPFQEMKIDNVMEALEVVTAALSALVAYPFMNLFDTVCDAILYCATVEQMRMEEEIESRASRASPPEPTMYARVTRQLGDGIGGWMDAFVEAVQLGCGGARPGHAESEGDDDDLFNDGSDWSTSARERSARREQLL